MKGLLAILILLYSSLSSLATYSRPHFTLTQLNSPPHTTQTAGPLITLTMVGEGGNGSRHMVSRVVSGQWFMVFSALLVLSVSGATYMFGSYSEDIKNSLGYDQTTLNLLSFFKDLGSIAGIPSGLLMEVTPPWVVLVVGAVLNFFGYFMMWLAVTKRIAKPAVWQMCLYICVGTSPIYW